MRSNARITARATAGFAADPDPATAPATLPPDSLFRLPDQVPGDGEPNALLLWLEAGTATEALTVEIWALDEETAPRGTDGTIPKPDASQRWALLNAAVVVTYPTAQVLLNKPYKGVLYVRQTVSTLTAATALKICAARL
jgi:hypothetical protein